MKLLHGMSLSDISDTFYCDQGMAKKIKTIARTAYHGEGEIYDALDALDYSLWRRGVIHSRRYSYLKHGYLDEEPTIIADHDFKGRGALGSRHGALFVGYVNELRDLR
jgi:hypothetical protein